MRDEKQNPHQGVRVEVAPQFPWGLPSPHVVIRWKLLYTCQVPCSRLGLMGCTCQCWHPSLSRGSRRRQVVPPKEVSSEHKGQYRAETEMVGPPPRSQRSEMLTLESGRLAVWLLPPLCPHLPYPVTLFCFVPG